MKISVHHLTVTHEIAAIDGAKLIVELSQPRDRYVLVGDEGGQKEAIAAFDDRSQAEDAAERLREQLAAMRPTLQ